MKPADVAPEPEPEPEPAVVAPYDDNFDALRPELSWSGAVAPEARELPEIARAPMPDTDDEEDGDLPADAPPAWAPPSRSSTTGRPNASSVVAELWAAREQQTPYAGPSGGAGTAAPPPRAGRTPGSPGGGKRGLIAAVVAVGVLLGGGAGVFLANSGIGQSSKTTFLAKADGICSQANTSVATLAKPTNYPELATAVGSVVTATDAQVRELQKVRLPGGAGSGQARDVVSALASTGVAVHGLQTAAAAKDDMATARATTQVSAAFNDANAKATAYGFGACATGMQAGMNNLIGGTKALIKTSFVAKADNICREGSRNLDAIPAPKKDNRDVARAYTQALSIMTKLMKDLRALAVPPGDEAPMAEILTAQDKAIAKFTEMRDAATNNDSQRYTASQVEFATLTTAADAKWDAYGLAVCGSNF